MPERNNSIGSESLEQEGPDLGNDFSGKDLSFINAGNALTDTPTMSAGSGALQTDYKDLNIDNPQKVDDLELLSDYDDDDDEIDEEEEELLIPEEDSEVDDDEDDDEEK